MITRRDLISGALFTPMLGVVSAAVAGTMRPAATPFERWRTDRSFSGLMALDDSMGPMCPGDLICLAGQPCNGKTLLLLQMALNVSNSCRTNVLFVSFREAPGAIGAKAPAAEQHHLVYGNLLTVPETFGSRESDASPGVWMMAGLPTDMPKIKAAVHRFQISHPAGCDMVILDGSTTDPRADRKILFGSNRQSDLTVCVPEIARDAPPVPLSEAQLAGAK